MQRVAFTDRREAGRQLGKRLSSYQGQDCLVLAIPRGGLPVGYEIAHALDCPLDVIVPRKLPIPWSPEAGFGAILPDGTRVLNERMVEDLGLTQVQVDGIATRVLAEVRRREMLYRQTRPEPDLTGRVVILTDDGLATGYTMIAAVHAIRKRSPREVVVAVPISPRGTAREVARVADRLLVLHLSDAVFFAVGGFYDNFHDLPDAEAKQYLDQAATEYREGHPDRKSA
jgi:putative phosphoribosyl transferase